MSNRKKIFFTSDWHVGHRAVIEFSKRPFRDIDHMHQVLINNYNAIVTPKSVCYFLGDVGLCGSDTMKKVFGQLNGTKVLVLGNHDKKHNAMYNHGFDVVLNSASLFVCGEKLTMTHCPLKGLYREDVTNMRGANEGDNWHGENKLSNQKFLLNNEGQFHLHGHIHSPNGGRSAKILNRQFDVGVDANQYRPVSISKIESWIVKTKQEEKENEKRRFFRN